MPGSRECLFRDPLVVGALGVAFDDIRQRRLGAVAEHTEASRPGVLDIARPLGSARVGVIDHEELSDLETGGQQSPLAVARTQHIEADTQVSAEEARAVER